MNNTKVKWEETTTESGIQLSGGSTTVTHHGVLIGFSMIPAGPDRLVPFFLVLPDGSETFKIINNCQPIV
jgi:hypothetical protein